jgi:RNA-directed DNA polymerase
MGVHVAPEYTQAGQGFDFLGYRFECGRRYVRQKSLKAFKDRVRKKTQRTCGKSLAMVTETLNPMLRGWFNYFQQADSYAHHRLDQFVRRRLRAILRKHQKRPGRGHTHADHRRGPNAYFAERGLFSLQTARILASRSR